MILRYIYNTQLAQASYLVGCATTGEALIVDPNRDIDQYIELAEREGLRITAVTETHIHADFASGARELAVRTGATLYLSHEGDADWKYAFGNEANVRLMQDRVTFMVGNIRIEAVHTPGHTPEHMVFVLTDTAGADRPMGVFTGDFVFAGDVGRPDLLERAAGFAGTMEAGARRLYGSLAWFRTLPDYLQVWPGHGAGSACGKALGAIPSTTVGYEKLFNWALTVEDEERFVEAVLAGQPEPPTYFAQMKKINKLGTRLVSDLPEPERLPEDRLESALAEGMTVVDTRPSAAFAGGHVPGTLSIPAGGSFLGWAGWLLPYDKPFALIVDERDAERLAHELRLIGLDHLAGYWTPDAIEIWRARHELAFTRQLTTSELRAALAAGEATVLDVRGASEYVAGHVPGTINIPFGQLPRRLAEVPDDRPVIVTCQTGGRSAVGASVLMALGRDNVADVPGGFVAWTQAGHPVERTSAEPALAGD